MKAAILLTSCTFLVGETPIEVTSQGLPDQGKYNEDNVVMNFRFRDGSLGVVSYLANGDKSHPKEYLEVFTGGRVAVLHDWRKLEMVYNGKRASKTTPSSRIKDIRVHGRLSWTPFKTSKPPQSLIPINWCNSCQFCRPQNRSAAGRQTKLPTHNRAFLAGSFKSHVFLAANSCKILRNQSDCRYEFHLEIV